MFRTVALTSLCLIAFASTAHAEDTVARAFLEQGMHQRDLGNDAGALLLFERAYAIEQTPRTQAQIALCQLALGDWAQGYITLTDAMSHDRDPWIQQRRAALTEALTAARAHIGFVRVEGGNPGQHVWVNGDDAGPLPHPELIVASVGEVNVELRDGASVLDARHVTVQAGATANATLVAPVPAPAEHVEEQTVAPASAIAAPNDGVPGNTLRTVGWTSLAIGSAGVVAGVVFQVMRENAVSHQRSCYTNMFDFDLAVCPEGEASVLSSVNRNGTGAVLGYAIGGTLVVTGVLLLLLTGANDEQPREHAFVCGPNVGVLGASCAGTF
ncbi:MAG: hypothetical protein IPK60_05635 [Sandaracinaceae bacterium]|jgi:hypothetical protein|nr:hypothetical protein [Sandaracinaceae bacterium]